MNKLETLKHYFGHDTFRPLQEKVVDAIINKEDVINTIGVDNLLDLLYHVFR